MTHGGHVCQSRLPYQFTGPHKTHPDTPFQSSSAFTDNIAAQSLGIYGTRRIDWTCAGPQAHASRCPEANYPAIVQPISGLTRAFLRPNPESERAQCASRAVIVPAFHPMPSRSSASQRPGCGWLRSVQNSSALAHDYDAPVRASEPIPGVFHHCMMFGNHPPNLVRNLIEERAIL